MSDAENILSRIRSGDRAALAGACTLFTLPPQDTKRKTLCDEIRSGILGTRMAFRLGVTGAGAAGKSTLIGALSVELLSSHNNCTVAVIGIDLASTKSGGAMLGDRDRIPRSLVLEPRFFFRSVAGHDAKEGLVDSVDDLVRLFSFAGYEWIIIESIGAGQDSVRLAYSVDALLLVLAPLGDWLTMTKSGVIEHADLIALNYGDFPTILRVENQLKEALSYGSTPPPPVFRTTSTTGEGIGDIATFLINTKQSAAL